MFCGFDNFCVLIFIFLIFRDVAVGDIVTVGECRPLSKTVRYNVLKIGVVVMASSSATENRKMMRRLASSRLEDIRDNFNEELEEMPKKRSRLDDDKLSDDSGDEDGSSEVTTTVKVWIFGDFKLQSPGFCSVQFSGL
ncbi:unnamed protein product [Gongylonema pulchrum]|uniref:Small ribosomal subunit protein uS17 n=1 Tax=Gongylonema pulchrum TaxID=637853 RepID=A0A3P7NJJ1_9BILA|nr:unnamed protein product [Gongylonema pulchrum]